MSEGELVGQLRAVPPASHVGIPRGKPLSQNSPLQTGEVKEIRYPAIIDLLQICFSGLGLFTQDYSRLGDNTVLHLTACLCIDRFHILILEEKKKKTINLGSI